MTAPPIARRSRPLENSPANAICASSKALNRRTRMELPRIGPLVIVAVLSLWLSGCGINNIPTEQEQAKAAWSEVQNQYQRRADLIPNLVNTVKGYAAQEQKVLMGVTEARARASSIQVTPEVLNNPQLFQKYQAAQGDLTQALKSLMVVVENY